MNKKTTRKAESNWKGNLKEGHGLVTTQSGILREARFSFSDRIEGEGKETNPEELIGAAVSSCFAMALSKTLQDEEKEAVKLRVHAEVTLTIAEDGPQLTDLVLNVEGLVPGFDIEQFGKAVDTTAENCPVLQLLIPGFDSVDINASLQQ